MAFLLVSNEADVKRGGLRLKRAADSDKLQIPIGVRGTIII